MRQLANILQSTFDKHRKLLLEHLNLNEDYSHEQVKKFFDDLKKQLTAKDVDYTKFIEVIKTISDKHRDYYAETASRETNNRLDMDQLMSFREDVYADGAESIYDYKDNIIEYMITVLITWRHVNQEYKKKRDDARGDQDELSMLDEHPGTSFEIFIK